MTILPCIQDGMERARLGKLSLYWQRDIEREYKSKKPTAAEKRVYAELQRVTQTIPQWSDEEELDSEMEKLGGQVLFCHFFREHNSMVQLTQDCNGEFDVSYVLDTELRLLNAKLLHRKCKGYLQTRCGNGMCCF